MNSLLKNSSNLIACIGSMDNSYRLSEEDVELIKEMHQCIIEQKRIIDLQGEKIESLKSSGN